ncbi:MAG: diadenylate cyclase [Desulfobacterales bacterium]|nr:diadenylate cyclase [Desulfobacterales bacterium]
MDTLFAFLSSIRWQDVVDITLNSYILFRLFVIFRETNAFRVLIGIALLWFFQRISVSLELIVTSWVIQGITAVAALIIVVVFRNEIRSVLQAKNLRAILWGFSFKPADTPLEIITDSVFELARRQTGALIVFPAKDDLGHVVQNGISWQGLVSKEMILSIFWHDNPVHDGAVIIKGNQITEVGVILPLSHRKDLPSYYGTRHRAAVGLAEATDALVVLVSEERKYVLVVKGSQVKLIPQKDDLAKILQEHLGLATAQKKDIKKEKLKIGIVALASVFFVIGVWFSFSKGLESQMAVEIPIEYTSLDPGMEILDTTTGAVRLQLAGSATLIKSIRPEQVKARINLDTAIEGLNTFMISDKNINLPPGIVLKSVKPSVVEVELYVPIIKKIPVQVDWVGKLPEHLVLEKVRLDPNKIQVMGSKKVLENISTIYTQKISLDQIEKTGKITVNLSLDPAFVQIAPGSRDKVNVEYVIKKRVQK